MDPSTDRRFFTATERAALWLAAGGKCTSCGNRLEPGWHADHVQPWSAHGPTDVINGQALCPSCNLTKGSKVTDPNYPLRTWQKEAARRFRNRTARDFLVCATPGAGKTRLALTLAAEALRDRSAERVVVVVPTDALRLQWSDEANKVGLNLTTAQAPEDYEKAGYDGCVVTYAQLAGGAGRDLLRHSTRRPTFAVIDEIHHAGDDRAWGKGLEQALGEATSRLALSGTPWRADRNSPIPFVTYDDTTREVVVDFDYEYGNAVSDGVCRRIEFNNYGGRSRWVEAGTVNEATLSEDLRDEDTGHALDAALNPRHEWMPALLEAAAAELDLIREEVPDAGGLVVANLQSQAQAYADQLEAITGERPAVVVSEDPKAKKHLDDFRLSQRRWLVAVKMVSEGVDVPRLAVGVYATKARTPLFFRQVIGRLVRARPDEYVVARLFMPAIPELLDHARRIEEELRHVTEELEKKERVFDGEPRLPFDVTSLSASPAELESSILGGLDLTPEQRRAAEDYCRARGLPPIYAPNIAADVIGLGGGVGLKTRPVTPTTAPESMVRQEKRLRSEITILVGDVARAWGVKNREVNSLLLKAKMPRRERASVAQLKATQDLLAQWLHEARSEQA